MLATRLGLSAAFTVLLLIASCGRAPTPSAARDATMPRVVTEFRDWCAAWDVLCPPGAAPNVPSATIPWTVEQWRLAALATRAVSQDEVRITLTRSELADANLTRVFEAFGVERLLADLRRRLTEDGVELLAVADGALDLTFSAPGSRDDDAGLKLTHDRAIRLGIGADASIAVSGMSVGGRGGDVDRLRSLTVSETNVLDWNGERRRVVGAPIKFVLERFLGLSFDAADGARDDFASFVRAFLPLRDWLTQGTRELDLHAATFAALASAVPGLVSDQTDAATVAYVLQRLRRVSSTSTTRGQRLLQAEASAEIRCELRRRVALRIAPQFALVGVERLGDDGVRVRMSGVTAKPLHGLLRPEISLDTVDVTTNAITVHNVPLIGTYTVDLDDPENEALEFGCGH